jgi:hypothetical protein
MATHDSVFAALEGETNGDNIFGDWKSSLNNITAFCALPHFNNDDYEDFGTTDTWIDPEADSDDRRLLQ